MTKFEKASDTGSVPGAERVQSINRRRAPLAQPSEFWQKRATTSFSEVMHHLNVLHRDLTESQVQRKLREEKTYTAMTGFGCAFTAFSNEVMPGTFKDQAEYLFRSEDTLFRWRTGQSIPPHYELTDLLAKVEKTTGRRVPAEREAILRDAHREASEVPRTLRQRLKAAEAELTETIKRDVGLADRVNELREEITSLKRQLSAAQGSGGFSSQDTLRSGQAPDRQEEEELRRRLVQAQQDLKEALKRQQESQQELRERAQKLVEAVDSYLALTSAYVDE